MEEDTRGVVKLGMPHDQRPEPKDLQRFLASYGNCWRDIGLELGLQSSVLDQVAADHRTQRECFRVTLDRWSQLNFKVTWGNLELAITNAKRASVGLEPLTTIPTTQSSSQLRQGDNNIQHEIDNGPVASMAISTVLEKLTEWERHQVESIDLLNKHTAEIFEYFKKRDDDLCEQDSHTGWLQLRVFMFDLYSMLDYTCYLLHCHFVNKGRPEDCHEKASQCGFPYKYKGVKISEFPGQNTFKKKFIDDSLKIFLGELDNANLRNKIGNIIFKVQRKVQVDGAGNSVERTMENNLIEDEKSFELLYYFRNYSTHRSLVYAVSDEVWAEVDVNREDSVKIVSQKQEREGIQYYPLMKKGYWIQVPNGREKKPRLLLHVLKQLQGLVKGITSDLLSIAFTVDG